MKQARTSFWYAGTDGREVLVKAGTVRSDDHPEVKRAPSMFADIDIEEPPAPKKSTADKGAPGKDSA